jgi:hypothetical protein
MFYIFHSCLAWRDILNISFLSLPGAMFYIFHSCLAWRDILNISFLPSLAQFHWLPSAISLVA